MNQFDGLSEVSPGRARRADRVFRMLEAFGRALRPLLKAIASLASR